MGRCACSWFLIGRATSLGRGEWLETDALSEGHILYMYTMVTSNCSHVEKILTYSLSLLPLFSLLLSFPGGRNLHLLQSVPHGAASLPCGCLPFRYRRLTHSFGGSLLMCIHEGARMVYVQCTRSHDTQTLGQTRKDTATQHNMNYS